MIACLKDSIGGRGCVPAALASTTGGFDDDDDDDDDDDEEEEEGGFVAAAGSPATRTGTQASLQEMLSRAACADNSFRASPMRDKY